MQVTDVGQRFLTWSAYLWEIYSTAKKATLALLPLPTRRRVEAAATCRTEIDTYAGVSCDSDELCTDCGSDPVVEDMDFKPYGRIGFFIEWARDIESPCSRGSGARSTVSTLARLAPSRKKWTTIRENFSTPSRRQSRSTLMRRNAQRGKSKPSSVESGSSCLTCSRK